MPRPGQRPYHFSFVTSSFILALSPLSPALYSSPFLSDTCLSRPEGCAGCALTWCCWAHSHFSRFRAHFPFADGTSVGRLLRASRSAAKWSRFAEWYHWGSWPECCRCSGAACSGGRFRTLARMRGSLGWGAGWRVIQVFIFTNPSSSLLLSFSLVSSFQESQVVPLSPVFPSVCCSTTISTLHYSHHPSYRGMKTRQQL